MKAGPAGLQSPWEVRDTPPNPLLRMEDTRPPATARHSSVARVLWAPEAEFPSERASAPHGGPASLPVSPRGGSAEGAGDTQGPCSPQEASTLSPWDGNALDCLLWGKAGPPRTPHPLWAGRPECRAAHTASQWREVGDRAVNPRLQPRGARAQAPTGGHGEGLPLLAPLQGAPEGRGLVRTWGLHGPCLSPSTLPASWVGTTEHTTARPPGLPALLESQVLTVPQ